MVWSCNLQSAIKYQQRYKYTNQSIVKRAIEDLKKRLLGNKALKNVKKKKKLWIKCLKLTSWNQCGAW